MAELSYSDFSVTDHRFGEAGYLVPLELKCVTNTV